MKFRSWQGNKPLDSQMR